MRTEKYYEIPQTELWPVMVERNILSGETTEDVTPGGSYDDGDFE